MVHIFAMGVSVTEAKVQLHALVRRAERGETVVITYRGRDAVKLVPDQAEPIPETKFAKTDVKSVL